LTIRKGVDWGTGGPLPADGVVVRSDAEARAVVTRARRAGQRPPPLGLLGGDLCRTLGGGDHARDEARLHSPAAATVRCDLGSALIDGRLHWFVAHAVLRRSWWRGRVVAVMNAQWHGTWDVAPRAHPGDGLLDVLDGDLPLGQRWAARARLATGTHLPHPGIRTARLSAEQFDLAPRLDVWLDGERVGRAATVSIRVEPDALTVVV
jgi:hypothetical protein